MSQNTTHPENHPRAARLEQARPPQGGNPIIRSHAQQFQDLERQLAAVQAEFIARFERLEARVDQGFNALARPAQVKREAGQQAARAHPSNRVRKEGRSQRLTQWGKTVNRETQAVLQEMLEQSSLLTASMHEKSATLLSPLEKAAKQRRRQGQAERAHLSALFGELSARLKDKG